MLFFSFLSDYSLLDQISIAAPCGVAVVVAVSKGGVNAIVGTAMSASLLPPIVNSGLCLGLALMFDYEAYNRIAWVCIDNNM